MYELWTKGEKKMSLDTKVYDERVEKELPPQSIPARITKGEALSTILPEDKILPTFATQKLCFLPGMSLMQELPNLLLRRDEPYEGEEGATATGAYVLQYENLMAILGKMDREFMLIKGVAF